MATQAMVEELLSFYGATVNRFNQRLQKKKEGKVLITETESVMVAWLYGVFRNHFGALQKRLPDLPSEDLVYVYALAEDDLKLFRVHRRVARKEYALFCRAALDLLQAVESEMIVRKKRAS